MPIPMKDSKALAVMAQHLRRAPRSIPELMRIMRISERSAYRWLKYLEAKGLDVVSRKDEKGVVHFSVLEVD